MSSPLPDYTGPDVDPDVIGLILNDHEWFRRRFAELDELKATGAGTDELGRAWGPLADRLDVHAIAEERLFYPQLLRRDPDPEEETLDAIEDHNDIREGVANARRNQVGTPAWWEAVDQAREANDEHMAEEEREGLADFRSDASIDVRREIGREFARFLHQHPTTEGLDLTGPDPETYVAEGLPDDRS